MKKKTLLFICLVTLLPIISCFGPYLPAPTNVYATQGTYNDKIVITWENDGDAVNFQIRRRDEGYNWISYYTSEREYEDYDIETNKIYYYMVRGMLGEYAGDYNNPPVSGWAGTVGEKKD